jgi:hypothetical protein
MNEKQHTYWNAGIIKKHSDDNHIGHRVTGYITEIGAVAG